MNPVNGDVYVFPDKSRCLLKILHKPPIQRKMGRDKNITFATVLKFIEMESKEYFEKVMLDYNQNRYGRSLQKYCKDEAIDYNWVIEYKKNYSLLGEKQDEQPQNAFKPIYYERLNLSFLKCRLVRSTNYEEMHIQSTQVEQTQGI